MDRKQYICEMLEKQLNERFNCDGCGFVDLGLPSGNLWMDRNLGAVSVTDIGDGYMWADTQVATDMSEYDEDKLNKYGLQTDMKAQIDLEDDAVYQAIGEVNGMVAVIPDVTDFGELFDLKHDWITDYNNSGVSGALITGYNGNTLFLPALSYTEDGEDYCLAKFWTNLRGNNRNAIFVWYDKDGGFTGVEDVDKPLQIRPILR